MVPFRNHRCGCSSSGRAPPCQGGGSEFEPRHPLQTDKERVCVPYFIRYLGQVVRQESAKLSFPSSNLGGTSIKNSLRFLKEFFSYIRLAASDIALWAVRRQISLTTCATIAFMLQYIQGGDRMEYLFFVALFIAILLAVFATKKTKRKKRRYNSRGFDHNRIHKNGTKYDDLGFDYYGYDIDGYNQQGYNRKGKNRKGQYDRFFDTTSCATEGFYDPYDYKIAVTTHARERFRERLAINDFREMDMLTMQAYRFGKSRRQIKKTSAYLVEEIEKKYDNSVVLIYKNVIYIFSCDNILKTLYKNDRIPL